MGYENFSPLSHTTVTPTGSSLATKIPGIDGARDASNNAPNTFKKPNKVRIVCTGGQAAIRLCMSDGVAVVTDPVVIANSDQVFSIGSFTHIAHIIDASTPVLEITSGWGN